MSKYVVSWASDDEGLSLTVSVHDTLEEARKDMLSYWEDLLMYHDIEGHCTEFDLSDGITYGACGNVGETWLSYRGRDGYGDEVRITEV